MSEGLQFIYHGDEGKPIQRKRGTGGGRKPAHPESLTDAQRLKQQRDRERNQNKKRRDGETGAKEGRSCGKKRESSEVIEVERKDTGTSSTFTVVDDRPREMLFVDGLESRPLRKRYDSLPYKKAPLDNPR
ncbi:hypothetical protein B0H34DRAFT_428100 [Crassisporium funariophilum]|nr:hypothetical protein B0H34DRAFT_464959 [Crassisporium funariophilum]KAF8160067.1 hypothetical protein B0H34DRAFT_428100 [Crassisporium funariophilum]